MTHPGFQNNLSRCKTGILRIWLSFWEKVDFPAPQGPNINILFNKSPQMN